jgi:uncharacterized phage-associated protein
MTRFGNSHLGMIVKNLVTRFPLAVYNAIRLDGDPKNNQTFAGEDDGWAGRHSNQPLEKVTNAEGTTRPEKASGRNRLRHHGSEDRHRRNQRYHQETVWPREERQGGCGCTRSVPHSKGALGDRRQGGTGEVGMISRGYNVLGVANEFLNRSFVGESPLTQMHLQKLCYIAHGFSLALLDRPLTSNTIEAWGFGPVYPDLYDALKKSGNRTVSELICENNWAAVPKIRGTVVSANLDKNEGRLVDTVWKDYGAFEAFQLSALTHEKGSPWARVFKPGIKHIVIPDSLIKEYFLELTKPNHCGRKSLSGSTRQKLTRLRRSVRRCLKPRHNQTETVPNGDEPDADYFLDNYGNCTAEPCRCRLPENRWVGRLCPHWAPLGVRSHAELSGHFRSRHGK